ncbi:MAG: hypothetical protein B9S34_08330 [Opitutia bacterium Tous-C1TDCM]|nr:MAG: hypothetical protein B9S34_08330 [Opitutae bacterium Tous-C1TDCM]
MKLTPEQTAAVAGWVAAGDNLSAVQKKLLEHFKITLTYRDVRFLVDDLDLSLKDQAPKVDASDVTKAQPVKTPAPARPAAAAPAPDLPPENSDDLPADDEALPPEDLADLPPSDSTVAVSVDTVTLIPGALASGTVTFSDGVTGKWIVDQYGRPAFTEVSQPGYRPTPADGQAFMQELSRALQQRGF